jgi:hypothetical protein
MRAAGLNNAVTRTRTLLETLRVGGLDVPIETPEPSAHSGSGASVPLTRGDVSCSVVLVCKVFLGNCMHGEELEAPRGTRRHGPGDEGTGSADGGPEDDADSDVETERGSKAPTQVRRRTVL